MLVVSLMLANSFTICKMYHGQITKNHPGNQLVPSIGLWNTVEILNHQRITQQQALTTAKLEGFLIQGFFPRFFLQLKLTFF